jgi:hypothetical protein
VVVDLHKAPRASQPILTRVVLSLAKFIRKIECFGLYVDPSDCTRWISDKYAAYIPGWATKFETINYVRKA